MNRQNLALDWLGSCQLNDGSWISDWEQIKEYRLTNEELQKHKIVYTSTICNLLSNYMGYDEHCKKAINFLQKKDEIDNPQYKIAFRLIAFTSLSEIEQVINLSTMLLKKIESGGVVNFDSRVNSLHFDNCFTLHTLINAFKLLKEHIDFEIDDRFKDLVLNVASCLLKGDAPTFWLWRASLISDVHNYFPEIITNSLEGKIKKDLTDIIPKIIAQQNQGIWPDKPPYQRTITPNAVSDEVMTAFTLRSLIFLYQRRWIDRNSDIFEVLKESTSYLLEQFDGICFSSKSICRNGVCYNVNDPYVNAVILETLIEAYRSKILKQSLEGLLLESFFQEPISITPDTDTSALQDLLNNAPEIIKQDITNSLNASGGEKNTGDFQVEFIASLPLLVQAIIGFNVRVKYAKKIDKQDIPTFNSWYSKLKSFCRKKFAQQITSSEKKYINDSSSNIGAHKYLDSDKDSE